MEGVLTQQTVADKTFRLTLQLRDSVGFSPNFPLYT